MSLWEINDSFLSLLSEASLFHSFLEKIRSIYGGESESFMVSFNLLRLAIFLYCWLRGDQNIGYRKRPFRVFGSSLEAQSHLKALWKIKLPTTSTAPTPGGTYILSFTFFLFCGLIWIYDTLRAILWITPRQSTVCGFSFSFSFFYRKTCELHDMNTIL